MNIRESARSILIVFRAVLINLLHFLRNLFRFTQSQIIAKTWHFDHIEQIDRYKDNSSTENKIAVCTAIFGNYDSLRLPAILDNDIDYICFTDMQLATFGVWKLFHSPYFNQDKVRIARYVKTHLHSLLPQYETLIWIDANVSLNVSAHKFLDDFAAKKSDMAFIQHPHRNCLYDELFECELRLKDSLSALREQKNYYKTHKLPRKLGLIESNFFIINNRSNPVRQFMRTWWSQIERFSRRDQPSLMYALHQHNINHSFILDAGQCVRSSNDFIFYPHSESKLLKPPSELTNFSKKTFPSHIQVPANVKLNDDTTDIIICVYNAYEKVLMCLESVVKYRREQDSVYVIDDESNEQVSTKLKDFCQRHALIYSRNDKNIGYVESANKGLSIGKSDFKILLNSDTVVTKDWVTKLLIAANSSDDIGIVGPISNAASYQSIPFIHSSKGQTVINTIDKDRADELAEKCLEWSTQESIPIVPFVHGFCFCIKQSVIDEIGLFDSDTFKRYYGEENDYCFRARHAGFTLAIATNCYIHHFKSESISNKERLLHMPKAGIKLRRKYGAKIVKEACLTMAEHPLLKSLRSKAEDYLA